jgi:hypothetical protein
MRSSFFKQGPYPFLNHAGWEQTIKWSIPSTSELIYLEHLGFWHVFVAFAQSAKLSVPSKTETARFRIIVLTITKPCAWIVMAFFYMSFLHRENIVQFLKPYFPDWLFASCYWCFYLLKSWSWSFILDRWGWRFSLVHVVESNVIWGVLRPHTAGFGICLCDRGSNFQANFAIFIVKNLWLSSWRIDLQR